MGTKMLASLVLLAGCCPGVVDLPDRFRPLERLEDDRSDPGAYHAFGPVLRGSTCDFLERPQREQEGLLLHEQLIAEHQVAYPGGLAAYQAACARDPRFLVSEELAGWRVQVEYCVRRGVAVDRLGIARFLGSRYGPTLDEESALYVIDGWIAEAKK